MAATGIGSDKFVIGGYYVPAQQWWERGQAVLYIRNGSWSQQGSLPEGIMNYLTPKTESNAVCSAEELFNVLGMLQSSAPQTWTLDENLQLFLRVQRLALEIVRQQDVLSFAGLKTMEVTELVPELLRATQVTDDDWIQTGGMVQHVAMWIPGLTDAYVQALRKLYISQADEQLSSSWHKGLKWPLSAHGQIVVDTWLCLCTNYLVRSMSEVSFEVEPTEKETGFRIPYRGEQELIQSWGKSLNSSDQEPFQADRWLVWRMLKQIFADSGWQSKTVVNRSGESTCHLEMELVPPASDQLGADWKLAWYIAHNHWSYRVPLMQWWQHPERVLWVGGERLDEPDKWFLPLLKDAAKVCEPIARALIQEAPFEAVLASDELMNFLYNELPKLSSLGVSIKSPEIDPLQVRDVRIRVQVRRTQTQGHRGTKRGQHTESWFDVKQLVDFDWSLVLGDSEISKEEFMTMVEEQSPYIQLGGSWRLIPIQEILKQVDSFQNMAQKGSANLLQFSRVLSLDEEDSVSVDVDYGSQGAFVGRWMNALQRASHPPQLETPDAFHGKLRQYQSHGFSWLVHLRNLGLGGCLADDMGLGKTIQVLAYLMYLKERDQAKGTHLLICPTSLLQNWRSELHRFTPSLKVYVHHGSNRNTPFPNGNLPLEDVLDDVDVVMTTYATVVRDMDLLSSIQWDAVVVDEAQNIKNSETKQATSIRGLTALHPIALTGTPVENRLEELWSIMEFLNPGYLGSLGWFRREFANRISQDPHGTAAKRMQLLLQPVLLRRRKTDAMIQVELPEKWEVREYAGLTTEQTALYQSIVGRLWSGISGAASQMSRRGQILAALVRLKQVCGHPCLVMGGSNSATRSAKLKLLLDLIEDVVDEEESALVFTQFRDMGNLICEAIEARFGWKPQFLHGGLTATARGDIVRGFQDGTDKSSVLVLSLKAGGVGLNLTRANHVFHFDRWWNPAVEDQATDRAFRIGQTKDVQVHKLVCSGTLEERIDQLITAKRTLSAAIVGESESWITEMDNDELKSLFALDKEAAMEVED